MDKLKVRLTFCSQSQYDMLLRCSKKGNMTEWNEWRKANPEESINLHMAKLEGADLGEARLSVANLYQADLRGANLNNADFFGADLSYANLKAACLEKAILREADLEGANLENADLTEVNLEGAYLWDANLENANLKGALMERAEFVKANLKDANLEEANLEGADLNDANLMGANLQKAYLDKVNFTGAELKRANLTDASLMDANFSGANLEEANLFRSDCMNVFFGWACLKRANLYECELWGSLLINCDLTGSNLTGTSLYGTAREDWIIKDVKCDYVYWDEDGKYRCPKERDFKQGEFERIYAMMPTIEYVFKEGFTPLDPLIMARVVDAIRQKRTEFDIKIDSINARGLAPSIKFTVQHEEHKEPALEEVRTRYEDKLKQLESERDRYYDLVSHALDRPSEVKLINAAAGSIVATEGSSVHIEQHIHQALELQKAVVAEPKDSESFAKVTKKKALDIIGGAIEDIAKGQVTEAAKLIVELGKSLGPLIAKAAAFAFFKGLL